MGELIDKIKKHFEFSRKEIQGLTISIILIAFMISFKDWGYGESFDAVVGAYNLFNALLIVFISLALHVTVQKIIALYIGYKAEFKIFYYGLLLGLVFVFVTNGNIFILLPGGITAAHLAGARIGRFRYGLNMFQMAWIGAAGAICHIFLAVIFKALLGITPNLVIEKAILINIWLAIFSLVPIPPLDGSVTFFGSRFIYFFSLGMIISMALVMWYLTIIPTLIIGIIFGIIAWIINYIYSES